MKRTIEVKVWDIEVDERYYSFKYEIKDDGKLRKEGSYDSDYCNGMSIKEWKKWLEDGGAINTVIEMRY